MGPNPYIRIAAPDAATQRTRTGNPVVVMGLSAAGIVADSVPEMEWRETEAKARALIRAAELVEEGF